MLRAAAPLLPGKGDTGAKKSGAKKSGAKKSGGEKSGGETRQASPSRRAGPATCDRSPARGEPIAVRRRLAYHPEQSEKHTITERQ